MGDLSKADLEGKVVFVRADLNVSGRAPPTGLVPPLARARTAALCPARKLVLGASLPCRLRACRANLLPCPPCSPSPQVPLDGDLKITDDTRIRAAVPTLKYLTDNGAKARGAAALCCEPAGVPLHPGRPAI